MSTAAQEMGGQVAPFNFNDGQIAETLSAQSTVAFGDAEVAAIAIMGPESDLAGAYLRLANGKSEQEGTRLSAGFVLGLSVLMASTARLESISGRQITDLEAIKDRNPKELTTLFSEDYAAHPSVTRLVTQILRYDATRVGARFAFTLHGDQANPLRDPRDLPSLLQQNKPALRLVGGGHAINIPGVTHERGKHPAGGDMSISHNRWIDSLTGQG